MPGVRSGPLAFRKRIASFVRSEWEVGAEPEDSAFTGVDGCEAASNCALNAAAGLNAIIG